MKLSKKTRERLYLASGKPIAFAWPSEDAPRLERGARYPVHGKDGARLFTIRVEGWTGHKRKQVSAVIDNDARRPMIGLKGVRTQEEDYESEPERVPVSYERQLAAEALWSNQRTSEARRANDRRVSKEQSIPTSDRSKRAKERHLKAMPSGEAA